MTGNELFVGGMVLLALGFLFGILLRMKRKKDQGIKDEDIDRHFFDKK